jgi:hypothetical protein
MSRTKKSRKPISEPTKKPKLSKKELESVEKRVRKKKGKQAGNRQKEAKPLEQASANNVANRDPRIGSKKPIDLGGVKVANTKPTKAKNVQHAAPIAAIRAIEPVESNFAAELEAIEDNPQLQAILAKQESGEDLSDQEVDLYNQQMTRYDELRDILGLEDDFDDEMDESSKSEDDLWDTLDKPKFDDFD